MTNTKNVKPTNVDTTAPKLSETDTQRIIAALAELQRLDGVFLEIENLRDAVAESAKNYARGVISLEVAAGLACIDPTQIATARGNLRHGVKMLMKDVIESVSDLIKTHRHSKVDCLLHRCQKMESGERENATTAGIHGDDYRASGMLESLREQHRRAAEQSETTISRNDLNLLANACGISC